MPSQLSEYLVPCTHLFVPVMKQGGSTTNLALSLESTPKQEDNNILLDLSVDGGIQGEGCLTLRASFFLIHQSTFPFIDFSFFSYCCCILLIRVDIGHISALLVF